MSSDAGEASGSHKYLYMAGGIAVGLVVTGVVAHKMGLLSRRKVAFFSSDNTSLRTPRYARNDFTVTARKYARADAMPPKELTELLSLMKKHKVTLYTSPRCPFCLIQTMSVQPVKSYIEVVNCMSAKQRCAADNVKALPYWKLPQDRAHVGLLRKRELLDMLRNIDREGEVGVAKS